MKTLITTSVLALSAFVVGAPPAAAQNREHQQMSAELRILQEQSQQLALALSQLGEAIKAVNGSITESNATTSRRFADLEQVMKGIANDVNVMRVRTDETNTLIRTLSDEIEALRMTLVNLPSLFTQSQQPDAFDPNDPNAVAPAAPPVAVPSPSTVGLSPSRMYDTAFGDYAAGQYTLAISGFEQLIRTFPQTERADDAQFFIGEAFYALTRFEDAINAYNALVTNYPRSDMVPMAIYKRGLSQERLGQTDVARASYEQVMKAYPDSEGGRLARQGVDRLGRPQQRP